MKKLIVILMALAGLNAYAGTLSFTNNITNTTQIPLKVECFPSETFYSDVVYHTTYKCSYNDTVMYFGFIDMLQPQAYLDAYTTLTATWIDDSFTGFHTLDNGYVWKILQNMNESIRGYKNVTANGSTWNHTIDGYFNLTN